jgi:hypothetical protein
MKQKQVKQHEPLRVPVRWTEQERSLVIQLNRILDEVYAMIGTLEQKIKELQQEDEP